MLDLSQKNKRNFKTFTTFTSKHWIQYVATLYITALKVHM